MAILGPGKESIGFHCNSARKWSLGDDVVFQTDGEHCDSHSRYVVDKAMLYTVASSRGERLPRAKFKPFFNRIFLGEPEATLMREMPKSFSRGEHYSRNAIEWKVIDAATQKRLRIIAATTHGRVDFIVLDTE